MSSQLRARQRAFSVSEYSAAGCWVGFWVLLAYVALSLFGVSTSLAQDGAPQADPTVEKQVPRRLTDVESLLGRPASTEMLWRMVERDLAYGLLEDAQRHLTLLLARPDLDDAKALELREKYGTGLFIRLNRHPVLAEMAQPLFERLQKAASDQAMDPERIRYFIRKLDDSPSERGYAISQLSHAGPYAIPFFVDALRDKRVEPTALIEGLMSMPRASWPAVAAVLDSGDVELMSVALDVLRRFGVPESTDFVWFVSGNPEYPQELRARARKLLADLLGVSADALPSPVAGLVDVANRFDTHKSGFGLASDLVTVWSWDRSNVVPKETSVSLAEEHYGLRAARQALELDPSNREAQVVLLNLALEGTFDRVGIETELPSAASGAADTALAAGSDLLMDVLGRANQSRRTAVALGAVRTLGETASPSAVAGDPNRRTALHEALDFPNSRVRHAAAIAALNIHPDRSFPRAERIVTTLVAALDPSHRPGALVLDSDSSRANATAKMLADLGYEPTTAIRGRDGFKIATQSQNIELIVVDPSIRDPGLLETLQGFEKDVRVSGVPVVVIAREAISESTMNQLRERSNVAVLPEIDDPKRFGEAMNLTLPDRALIPWTESERRENRVEALQWLGRIARGEMGYLDPMPAVEPLGKLLPEADFGPLAASALAFLASPHAQQQLAITALNGSLDSTVRAAAARGLAKNLQRHPSSLDSQTIAAIAEAWQNEADAELRSALATAVGTIDKSGKSAGSRLRRYQPGEPVDADPPSEDSASPQ